MTEKMTKPVRWIMLTISTAIVTAIGATLWDFIGGWATLVAIVNGIWKWFTSDAEMPVWLLCILIAFAMLFILTFCLRVYYALKPEKTRHLTYVEDTLFGLVWRWGYSQGYSQDGIENLCAFCPACDFQIIPEGHRSYGGSFTSYRCEKCDKIVKTFNYTLSETESLVRREIHRILRQKMRESQSK